jgi:hypothetical protein
MTTKIKSSLTLLSTVFALLLSLGVSSCGDRNNRKSSTLEPDSDSVPYEDLYDPIADVGQYSFPEMTVRPKKYWNLINVLGAGDRNKPGVTDPVRGLQYHLLSQSIAGLTNAAVDEGRSEIGVWLGEADYEGRESYGLTVGALNGMGIAEQGRQTGVELAKNDYEPADGVHIQIKDLFDGYVLTDVENNPESNIVASVASHVYNSIIVDVRDKAGFDAAGYTMTYDATRKSTADAWREFRDKCSNKALVVMPVGTGELRDFAIKNDLFVLNINHLNGDPKSGQNLDIFAEALQWLEPGAPVFGWEQGVSEDLFVARASRMGRPWVPSDWLYNLPMTSLTYSDRQSSVLAKVENPRDINYDLKKNFVAFWLTDGDNIQWMMNGFVDDFYLNVEAADMKMGFGIPVSNLAMTSPEQFADIINKQKPEYTLIEALGGGYLYADTFGDNENRQERLAEVAERVGASMRQHRVKVLGLIAHDVMSDASKEGFQAYIDANDQLEGIVAIQYSPYAGGEGEIMWLTNKKGYDIPVITVKYSLWNFGNRNTEREGTPAYVADRLTNEAGQESFSLISVHAWSRFRDIGNSNDPLDENNYGNLNGASAATLLMNHLGDDFQVVSVQELIWRARMNYRKEQTEKFLRTIR